MNKINLKKLLTFSFMMLLGVVILLSNSMKVEAAAKAKLFTQTFFADKQNRSCSIMNVPYDTRVVSVTSSNTKVLKATLVGKCVYDINLVPLKAGKSTVTVKYKLNGKTKSVSGVYTVKNIPNFVNKLTINGKSVKVGKSSTTYNVKNYKKSKVKVNLKFADDWEIVDSGMLGYIGPMDWEPLGFEMNKEFKINHKKVKIWFSVVNKNNECLNFEINFLK